MTYQDALRRLASAPLLPLYLLCGEEPFFIQELLAAFRARIDLRDFNDDLLDGDLTEPAQMIRIAETLPVLCAQRLIVVRDAERIKDDRGVLTVYFKNPCKTTTLVFVSPKPDMRKGLFVALKGAATIITCAPLAGSAVADWITREGQKRGLRFTAEALAFLQAHLGHNLFRIQQELDKLALSDPAKGPLSVEIVSRTVAGGRNDSVFDLIDTIAKKEVYEAIRRLSALRAFGEPPLLILSLLARQWRMMALAKAAMQTGCTPSDAAGKAGIPPFRAARFMEQIKRWRLEEIRHAFDLTLSADLQLKGGRVSPDFVLEALILDLCGPVSLDYCRALPTPLAFSGN
jgi:DNA polymerase-3 subunit delta